MVGLNNQVDVDIVYYMSAACKSQKNGNWTDIIFSKYSQIFNLQ